VRPAKDIKGLSKPCKRTDERQTSVSLQRIEPDRWLEVLT